MMQEIVIDAVMITTIRAAIATITPTRRPSMVTGGLDGGTAKEQTNKAKWSMILCSYSCIDNTLI